MIMKLRFIIKLSLLGVFITLWSCSTDEIKKIEQVIDDSANSEEVEFNEKQTEQLLILYLQNGKWGYVDTTGQLIIPANYQLVYGFTEGFAAVKQENTWGFIDKSNRWVIAPTLDSCQPFFGNMAAVMQEGLWGFINYEGEIRIPFQYEHVKPFCEGFAAVSDGNKWGFIDISNNIIIDFIYDEILTGFYSGKANVISGAKLFSVDSNGKKYNDSPQSYH